MDHIEFTYVFILPEVQDVARVIEPAATPPEMTVKLLPFQAEGLTWMKGQELGEMKGGILAVHHYSIL